MDNGCGSPAVTFECQQCNFRTKNYHSLWRKHMLLEDHQIKARERVKLLDFKAKKRAVVVFGLSSVKSKDVLKYFGDLAVLTDFLFWKERPDFCILIFLYSKFRDSILLGSHVVQNRKLFLRALDEIPEAEWISICPYAAHPQETDGDSGGDGEDLFQESSEDEIMSDGDTHESMSMSTQSQTSSRRSHNVNGNQSTNGNGTTNSVLPPTFNSNSSTKERKLDGKVVNSFKNRKQAQKHDFNFKNLPSEIDEGELDIDFHNSDFDTTATFDKPFLEENENCETQNIDERPHSNDGGTDAPSDREQILNSMMENFYDRNLMNKEDWELRKLIKDRLQVLLGAIFPTCELIPFGVGSTAISSGRESLCIYVDIFGRTGDDSGQAHTMDLDVQANQGIMANIMKVLGHSQLRTEICDLKSIEDKITFTYIATRSRPRVECSLQATNFLTVQCCSLLNFFCNLDDRVRPLLIILRHWGYHHQLVMSNPGHHRSDVVFHPSVFQWLVIYFLSHKNIIPSIQMLQNNAKCPLLYGGDNVAFCNNVEQLDWEKPLKFEINPLTGNPSALCVLQLAQEMFEYFGTHIMGKSLISVNVGTTITKKSLRRRQRDNFSGPFQSTTAWEQTTGLNQRFVMVQHPLKLYINMTNRVSSQLARLLKLQSRYTAQLLKSLLLEDSPLENPTAILVYRAKNDTNNGDRNETIETQSSNCPNLSKDEISNKPDEGSLLHSKRHKIKDFNLQLLLSAKLTNRILTTADDTSLIPQMWLHMFEHFNRIVWPACFGVQLYTLPDETPLIQLPKQWEALTCPFKGVVIDSTKLNSITGNFDNKKKRKQAFLSLSTQLTAAMKKRRKPLSKQSESAASKEKLFSFDCQVRGHISTSVGTIVMHFTNVFYDNNNTKGGKEAFRKTIITLYKELWDFWSTGRILKSFPKSSTCAK